MHKLLIAEYIFL